jgi:hypothetical protein
MNRQPVGRNQRSALRHAAKRIAPSGRAAGALLACRHAELSSRIRAWWMLEAGDEFGEA